MDKSCTGEHEIYVAEVVAVEAEGKLVVITVCRLCNMVTFHEKTVFPQHSPVNFTKKEK